MITVDLPGAYIASAAQTPGELAPVFTVKVLPDRASVFDPAWLRYTPPAATITIGDIAYPCLPMEFSVDISPESGVDIEIQYLPADVVKLDQQGRRRHLVFLSCPVHEYEAVQDDYPDTEFEVLHRDADARCTNGWTVNDIIAEISKRAGVPLRSKLPTLHVAQKTTVLSRGQPYWQFLTSLLPQGARYVWQPLNGVLTVLLVPVPSATRPVTFPPGSSHARVQASAIPAYTYLEITGGDAAPGYDIELKDRGTGILGSASHAAVGVRKTRTFPLETREVNGVTETTLRTQTYLNGLDEEVYAVTAQTLTTTTPAGVTTTQETCAFDGRNPLEYDAPRLTTRTVSKVGLRTMVSAGFPATGEWFGLTTTGQLLDRGTYFNIPIADRPTIAVSAYQLSGVIQEDREVLEYVADADATKDWRAGLQTRQTQTVAMPTIRTAKGRYRVTRPPQDVLQYILADAVAANPAAPVYTATFDATLRDVDIVDRKVLAVSAQTYEYEQITRTLNEASNTFTTQRTVTPVDSGAIPFAPLVPRVRQLRAVLADDSGTGTGIGTSGDDDTVIVAPPMSIPTNNRQDFETWAGLLYQYATTAARTYHLTLESTFYAPGMLVGGMFFTGFTVSRNEDLAVEITATAE